jgi:hypothetical protein
MRELAMNAILTHRSGPDSILHLQIPVPRPGIEYEIEVVVRPKPTLTTADWQAWVTATAGTWQGDFERPPQMPPEERNPLS